MAGHVGDALWTWVREQQARDPGFRLQLDEPRLGMAMSDADIAIRETAYSGAADLAAGQVPLVTVQFGHPSDETVSALGRLGFAVQLPLSQLTSEAARSQPELVASVMDGRSVWPDDFGRARDALAELADDARPIRLVPSTSLMFLPYTVDGEDLPAGFQFAREKASTLATWAAALAGGHEPDAHGHACSRVAGRRQPAAARCPPRTSRGTGGPRPASAIRRPPPARCRRPATFGGCASSSTAASLIEAAYDDAIGSASSPMPSAGRRGWAWTCWSTASSSGPTWSSTSPSRWMAT